MNMEFKKDDKVINTIRSLAMDIVQKANSGHPGTAMVLAPLAYTLYSFYEVQSVKSGMG